MGPEQRGRRAQLSPAARKAWLLAHVVLSVGWLGAGAANVSLGAHAWSRPGGELTPLLAHHAIRLIDTWVVIPAAFGALISGLVVSLGTRWGLFVHWWVTIKLVLTVVVILASTVGIGRWIEESVADGTPAAAQALSARIVALGVGNLLAFGVMTALSVYKPRGTIRGIRKPPGNRDMGSSRVATRLPRASASERK